MDNKSIKTGSMVLSDIIEKNPYSPSPRGYLGEFEIVGREEVAVDFWNFIHLASTRKFIPVIIRAPYGGGKTTFLRWLTEKLSEKESIPLQILDKRVLTIYTKLPHPSFDALVNGFIDEVKLHLDEQNRDTFMSRLSEYRGNLERYNLESTTINHIKLYNGCLDILYILGFDIVIHIIDEFEAIAEIPPDKCRGFLHEFRDLVDEIDERPLVLVLGCTDEAYRRMEEIHPALVSRVPEEFRKDVDTQLKFTLENTLELISSKLEAVRKRNPELENPYYPFDRDAIQTLYDKSGGNVRVIEQACYFALQHALETNGIIDRRVIVHSLHKVISDKAGNERKHSMYNLIDDPYVRDALINDVRRNEPETIKNLIHQSLKRYLMTMNFDYQFEYEADYLGEKVSMAWINTHAYRTIPINLSLLVSTVPAYLGESDLVDAVQVREECSTSMCILIRITQEERDSILHESKNVLEVRIPWSSLEEFYVLPHLSHLDADNICRKLESEYKIIDMINRWINIKKNNGEIIGERFRKHEMSIYKLLWYIGEGDITIDKAYKFARKQERKYSKITLVARLENLEGKNLLVNQNGKIAWTVSPIMRNMYNMINDEFDNNPVTPMDLKTKFLGGSRNILYKYMDIMESIGILEKVKVGRHSAFKSRDPQAEYENACKRYDYIQNRVKNYTSLPNSIHHEIRERLDIMDQSYNNMTKHIKDGEDVGVLTNCHRIHLILGEIDDILKSVKDELSLIEKEHEFSVNILNSINRSLDKLSELNISVESYATDSTSIKKQIEEIYTQIQDEGKISNTYEQISNHNKKLVDIDDSLNNIMNSYTKLVDSLANGKKIVKAIESLHSVENADGDEVIIQLNEELDNAELALNHRQFAKAEFHLLKTFQNNYVNNVLYKHNLRITELTLQAEQVISSAFTASRLNAESNFMSEIQEMRMLLKEIKEDLSNYELITLNNKISVLNKRVDDLSRQALSSMVQWFSTILTEENSLTPHEISMNFKIKFDTILEAINIMLRNNKMGVVWRKD